MTTLDPKLSGKAIKIQDRDNVVTVIEVTDDLGILQVWDKNGQNISTIDAKQSTEFRHTVALFSIAKGQEVIKYGEIIGRATSDIQAGKHDPIHNINSTRRPQ